MYDNRYLTADYGRSEFFVSQRNFAPIDELILPISSTDVKNSSSPGNSNPKGPPKKSLSTGATAGIAVAGALGGISALALAVLFFLRRRRSQNKSKADTESPTSSNEDAKDAGTGANLGKAELHAEDMPTPHLSAELGVDGAGYFKPEKTSEFPTPSPSPAPREKEDYLHQVQGPVYEMSGEGIGTPELYGEGIHRAEMVGEGVNLPEMASEERVDKTLPELSSGPKSPTSPVSPPQFSSTSAGSPRSPLSPPDQSSTSGRSPASPRTDETLSAVSQT